MGRSNRACAQSCTRDVINGAGRPLLPGVINAHVHLANDGAPDLFAQVRDDSIPLATLRAARNAHLALESGVRSVCDCGASSEVAIELGRAIADGLVVRPRVQAARRIITMTGGHGHFMGREADNPFAVRSAVRAEVKLGADFIRVMAKGGVLTPGVDPAHPGLNLNELAAAVDEGLELAVHLGITLVPTLSAIPAILNQPEGAVPGWVIDKAQRELQRSRDGLL